MCAHKHTSRVPHSRSPQQSQNRKARDALSFFPDGFCTNTLQPTRRRSGPEEEDSMTSPLRVSPHQVVLLTERQRVRVEVSERLSGRGQTGQRGRSGYQPSVSFHRIRYSNITFYVSNLSAAKIDKSVVSSKKRITL